MPAMFFLISGFKLNLPLLYFLCCPRLIYNHYWATLIFTFFTHIWLVFCVMSLCFFLFKALSVCTCTVIFMIFSLLFDRCDYDMFSPLIGFLPLCLLPVVCGYRFSRAFVRRYDHRISSFLPASSVAVDKQWFFWHFTLADRVLVLISGAHWISVVPPLFFCRFIIFILMLAGWLLYYLISIFSAIVFIYYFGSGSF